MKPDILPFATPDWEAGWPRDPQSGDVFFSHQDPLGERAAVFLRQGGLAELIRRKPHVVVAEIGWGSGVSSLLTLAHFLRHAPSGARLDYVAIEHRPWRGEDLWRLWSRWPELLALGETLLAAYPPPLRGFHRRTLFGGRVRFMWVWGEADQSLADWDPGPGVDLWYLDGFAPRRNPSAWSARLFELVAACSAPQARFTTYSAAGDVRRGLQAVGFRVEKVPGFGGKREALRGVLERRAPRSCPASAIPRPPPATEREAVVIGAGLAGAWMCRLLVERGWTVHRVTGCGYPAMGASGNPRGLIMPRPVPDHGRVDPTVRLHVSAVLQAMHAYRSLGWVPEGVLQRVEGEGGRRTLGLGEVVGEEAASALAGVSLSGSWIHWQAAGTLSPVEVVTRWLEIPCESHWCMPVAALRAHAKGWALLDGRGRERLTAPVVIVAAGAALGRLLPEMPVTAVRGQLAFIPSRGSLAPLRLGLCSRAGYVTPAHEGWHCLGASFEPRRAKRALDPRIHADLVRRLRTLLPHYPPTVPGLRGRVAWRAVTADRMPLIGPVPDGPAWSASLSQAARRRRVHRPAPSHRPGLYVLGGLGSHGLAYAPWGAELLMDLLEGAPLPLEDGLRALVDPARFILRRWRRGTL